MIKLMTWSRTKTFCCCLIWLAIWLAVACAAATPTPTMPSHSQSDRLYTRTPIPTALPTPTSDPFVLYLEGLSHRDTWDLSSALDRYNTALTAAPTASLYARRAEVYRLLNQYKDANADIERALDLDPELAAAWREKALLSYTQAAWEQALTAVDRLIELEPDDAAAYALRAQINDEGFGKLPQALVDYGRAIRRDPIFDKATLVERWYILAKLGYWEEALQIGHKMTTSGSADPLRYFYRAWSLIQLGRLDEAIQLLFFGIERYPDYAVALYYALGVAYYERQAWSEAVLALEVALTESSKGVHEDMLAPPVAITEADILGRMGVAYLEQKQCETGAAMVERAIAESANLSDWYWARKHIEACYIAITPTPTLEGTLAP